MIAFWNRRRKLFHVFEHHVSTLIGCCCRFYLIWWKNTHTPRNISESDQTAMFLWPTKVWYLLSHLFPVNQLFYLVFLVGFVFFFCVQVVNIRLVSRDNAQYNDLLFMFNDDNFIWEITLWISLLEYFCRGKFNQLHYCFGIYCQTTIISLVIFLHFSKYMTVIRIIF